jgi:hypothetical protein
MDVRWNWDPFRLITYLHAKKREVTGEEKGPTSMCPVSFATIEAGDANAVACVMNAFIIAHVEIEVILNIRGLKRPYM